MNAKQTFPIVAALSPEIVAAVPPLLIIGGIVALAAWLLSDDDKKETENAPAKVAPATKPSPIPLNSGRHFTENHGTAAIPGGKSSPLPARVAVPANAAHAATPIPIPKPPIISAVKTPPPIPPAAQKKSITRADMAKIFNSSTRGLTRKSAVTALKALGFRKSAAYEALAINGRFMSWLQFAPGGLITWKG